MIRLRVIFVFTLTLFASVAAIDAQEQSLAALVVKSLAPDSGSAEYDPTTGEFTATNDVLVTYGGAVLTANSVRVNTQTGDVFADGKVRIQQGEQVWVSEHIRFNFYTRQIQAEQFRTGHAPFFSEGKGLSADITNHLYIGSDAMITSEDIAQP